MLSPHIFLCPFLCLFDVFDIRYSLMKRHWNFSRLDTSSFDTSATEPTEVHFQQAFKHPVKLVFRGYMNWQGMGRFHLIEGTSIQWAKCDMSRFSNIRCFHKWWLFWSLWHYVPAGHGVLSHSKRCEGISPTKWCNNVGMDSESLESEQNL